METTRKIKTLLDLEKLKEMQKQNELILAKGARGNKNSILNILEKKK